MSPAPRVVLLALESYEEANKRELLDLGVVGPLMAIIQLLSPVNTHPFRARPAFPPRRIAPPRHRH